MIPKIIHYCWFGHREKPQSVLDCIDTWKKILPDYQIKEWNEINFDIKLTKYTYEAYLLKKYAFVSDVARLYALSQYGGIYLDTDVRVLKTFNPFLDKKSFLSFETPFIVGTAVIGAESNVSWLRDYFESYKYAHFIRLSGRLKTIPNTESLSHFLHIRYPQDQTELELFGIEVFTGKLFSTNQYLITDKTICVHEYNGSWLNGDDNFFHCIRNIILRIYLSARFILGN